MKSALAVLVFALGCASSPAETEPSSAGDGGAADAASPDAFSGAVPFKTGGNVRCVPFPLGTGCHVLLTGVTMGCDSPGLSPAAQADIDAVTAASLKSLNAMVPPTPICELAELTAGNCSAATEVGWCYIRGSCSTDAGVVCDQAICESSSFHEGEGYKDSWLVCP